MNADERGLPHRAVTDRVLGAFFEVYNELGVGFLVSVYEGALAVVLRGCGLRVVRQPPIVVRYRGVVLGEYRPDLVVEDAVIVELKAARAIEAAHEAQLLNYLRSSDLEVGLLLNFGPKPSFRRFGFANVRNAHPRPSASIRGVTPPATRHPLPPGSAMA